MSQRGDQTIYRYRGGTTGGMGIKTVIVEPGVTVIDGYAFASYNELKHVTFPASVKEGAFACCTSLEDITIPEGVTVINLGTFTSCRSLKRVELPDSLTEIGVVVFAKCKALRHINIPKQVRAIGKHAFKKSGIEEIAIPHGVERLSEGAFIDCRALHTVQLPASLEEFDFETFSCCFNLEKFVYPDGLPLFYELNLAFYELEKRGWEAMAALA